MIVEYRGITIAAAKYSSEDAAVLVEFTVSIIEYSRRCAPLSTAVKKLDLLELELEHMKQHENIKNEVSMMYFIVSILLFIYFQPEGTLSF